MVTEIILTPIGKGQITIPMEWRKSLGIDKKQVKATLAYGKIIIEPLEKVVLERDVDTIELNTLSQETIDAIIQSEQSYKKGDTDVFLSHEDFWANV